MNKKILFATLIVIGIMLITIVIVVTNRSSFKDYAEFGESTAVYEPAKEYTIQDGNMLPEVQSYLESSSISVKTYTVDYDDGSFIEYTVYTVDDEIYVVTYNNGNISTVSCNNLELDLDMDEEYDDYGDDYE